MAPSVLTQLLPVLAGEADLVVGSRYLENSSDVPAHRVWGHRAFNVITAAASGVLTTDSQSGYRALSSRALGITRFSSRGFSVESEMQFLAHEHNLRVKEVPITIRYVDKPKRPVMSQGVSVLSGILRLMGQMRPLLFFGVPGFALLLFGLLAGVRVVDIFTSTRQLATGTAMISILLSLIGLMMLSTGFTLHSIRGLLSEMLRNSLWDKK